MAVRGLPVRARAAPGRREPLTGAGPVLVFLHGLGGNGRVWRRQQADLARSLPELPSLALDLPGIAGPLPDSVTGFDSYVSLVHDAVAAMAPGRAAAVVGNSFGGAVGLGLALRHPATVSRLGLIDSVGLEVPGIERRYAGDLPPLELLGHMYHRPARAALRALAVLPATVRELRAGRRLLGRVGEPPDHVPQLSRLTQPTLVLWGSADRLLPEALGRDVSRRLPAGEFRSVAGAGHLPHVEQPGRVTRLLEAWLRRTAVAVDAEAGRAR